MNGQLYPVCSPAPRLSALELWCRWGLRILFFISVFSLGEVVLEHVSALFDLIELRHSITHLGVAGPGVYLAVLALSVVISPIPGAPLVVMGGVMG